MVMTCVIPIQDIHYAITYHSKSLHLYIVDQWRLIPLVVYINYQIMGNQTVLECLY